jgi:hypothetical protein
MQCPLSRTRPQFTYLPPHVFRLRFSCHSLGATSPFTLAKSYLQVPLYLQSSFPRDYRVTVLGQVARSPFMVSPSKSQSD